MKIDKDALLDTALMIAAYVFCIIAIVLGIHYCLKLFNQDLDYHHHLVCDNKDYGVVTNLRVSNSGMIQFTRDSDPTEYLLNRGHNCQYTRVDSTD